MKSKDNTKPLSPQALQKIQDSYSLALGISVSIKDMEGKTILPATHQSKLWELIEKNDLLQKEFEEQLHNSIEKCTRTGQIIYFERHPNFHSFLAPIYTNGKIVAFFLSGIVRFSNPNLDIAEQNAIKFNVDIDTYLDAFLNLPFLTRERFEASANLIKIIGSTIYSLEDQGTEVKEKNNELREENQKLIANLNKTTSLLQTNKGLNK